MDRGNSKHGRRLDEEMARETRGLTQGQPADARVEEWREAEPSGDDQPAASMLPDAGAGDPGSGPSGMTADERDARTRVGQSLRRSAFPADRAALLREAAGNEAPDEIVALLRGLPEGPEFRTAAEVWAALRGTTENELERRF